MIIKVMPPELSAQIAAGEVVERPASVVKELVENSIDAGASLITVEIQGGGIDQIRVVDNGSGIPAEEVVLAFQHHATSKLSQPEQLDSIGTLGFRGEAIPSIAAVSQMSLTTRTPAASAGYRVEYQWGHKIREGAQGGPPGTTVVVADLFGNLPARRKFLRSASAEAGRIQDLMSRYALAYPELQFQLKLGTRQALHTPGNGKPDEALLAVYGPEVARGMLPVHGVDPETGYQVDGFVSSPGLNRANRTYITLFVNRRWIQNRMLAYALEEAYHGLLPEKRYPLAVVNLTLPYADVDVNSHPAKREVRFHQEGKVFSTLQRAVRSALIAQSPVPDIRRSSSGAGFTNPETPATPGFFWSAFDRRSAGPSPNSMPSAVGDPLMSPGPADAAMTPRQALPSLRVVGQVQLTYIVAESPDGMYLVDQHAAHERVLFDRIVRKAAERTPEVQALLAPVSVELTPGQLEVLRQQFQFLTDYGFELESFGGTSYLLRAVPSLLVDQDPAQALTDVLDLVAFEGLLRQREDILAASIACHSAIRAGKSLTEAEMWALLEQLEATDNPHTCPHGRPTLLHFSSYNMEREFGRR